MRQKNHSAERAKEHTGTVVYDECIEATTHIVQDTLTYTSKFNNKPLALIMENLEKMKLPPLVNAKACIRHNSVQYLDALLKNSKDEAPADFVENKETESDDDLDISIL